MPRKIIIIGAGISGLSAGCYARMNGYDTEIYDMHTVAGGLCTGWRRKGYYFDHCIHWLMGSRAGGNFANKMWNELGALNGVEIVNHDVFCRVLSEDGKEFTVYTDNHEWESYLKGLAPEDCRFIEKMCRTIRLCSGLDSPEKPVPLLNVVDYLALGVSMSKYLKVMKKYGKMSMVEFVSNFKNKFVREMLLKIYDTGDFPALGFLATAGYLHAGNAGYPVGGSRLFASKIADRYAELGGALFLGKKVVRIIVEEGCAKGILLEDGSLIRGDIVVSAADGYSTVYRLLEGKYVDSEIEKLYALQDYKLYKPLIQVSLGVDADLSARPHRIIYEPARPIPFASPDTTAMNIKHYCYDRTVAPKGKSVVIVLIETSFDRWNGLFAEKHRYEKEKETAGEQTIDLVQNVWPEIRGKIEVIDVATPMTTVKYTGNWKGAYGGWLISTETNYMKPMKNTLPGLCNFYMTGQWQSPGGGISVVAKLGRDLIYTICHKEKKKFTTG